MIMKVSRFMLVLALSGLYSCGDNDSEVEKQYPLYPLSIGNSWTYEQTTYTDPPQTNTNTATVNYYLTIDGQKGFSSQEYVGGEPISLINNDEEGNCIEYLFNKDKLVHKTILFKKNVNKGDKWVYKAAVYTDYDYSQYEIRDMEKTCIASDSLIETPKGSFKCIVFSHNPGGYDEQGNPQDIMIHFLSTNVGLVKYQHYENVNGNLKLLSESSLTEYTKK
jgi:hypothetical protein